MTEQTKAEPHFTVERSFYVDGEKRQHIPTLILRFPAIPSEALAENWRWEGRDNYAKWLAYIAAAPEQPAPQPVGWMHVLDNTEGIRSNKPWVVFSESKRNPFGKPGVDYSKEYPVTSTALYAAPPDARAVIRQLAAALESCVWQFTDSTTVVRINNALAAAAPFLDGSER